MYTSGRQHSSVDPSRPWVQSQSTRSMLFQFKFEMLGENDENKPKEAGIGPLKIFTSYHKE